MTNVSKRLKEGFCLSWSDRTSSSSWDYFKTAHWMTSYPNWPWKSQAEEIDEAEAKKIIANYGPSCAETEEDKEVIRQLAAPDMHLGNGLIKRDSEDNYYRKVDEIQIFFPSLSACFTYKDHSEHY